MLGPAGNEPHGPCQHGTRFQVGFKLEQYWDRAFHCVGFVMYPSIVIVVTLV